MNKTKKFESDINSINDNLSEFQLKDKKWAEFYLPFYELADDLAEIKFNKLKESGYIDKSKQELLDRIDKLNTSISF